MNEYGEQTLVSSPKKISVFRSENEKGICVMKMFNFKEKYSQLRLSISSSFVRQIYTVNQTHMLPSMHIMLIISESR